MPKTISLTKGYSAIVDDDVYEELSKYKWFYNNGYAARNVSVNGKQKQLKMHRVIMCPSDDKVVDHINGDTLDNRHENLRVCSTKENIANKKKPSNGKSSRYKGVSFKRGKYEARIRSGDTFIYLGRYCTEVEAAIAYNNAATLLFSEFAKLNDIPIESQGIVPKRDEQSSFYRGVSYHKRIKKWQARVQVGKLRHHVGYFDREVDAALAYNREAKKLLGDKAKLNVILEGFNDSDRIGNGQNDGEEAV